MFQTPCASRHTWPINRILILVRNLQLTTTKFPYLQLSASSMTTNYLEGMQDEHLFHLTTNASTWSLVDTTGTRYYDPLMGGIAGFDNTQDGFGIKMAIQKRA